MAALPRRLGSTGARSTSPPGAPGTAPRDQQQAALGVDAGRPRRFCVVRVTSPMWPAMRLPGNTRPGSCAADRARRAVRQRVAVRGVADLEVVALDRAREALALGRCPATSTIWPTSNMSRLDLAADCELAELVGCDAEFPQATRLRPPPWRGGRPAACHARRACAPNVTCTAGSRRSRRS